MGYNPNGHFSRGNDDTQLILRGSQLWTNPTLLINRDVLLLLSFQQRRIHFVNKPAIANQRSSIPVQKIGNTMWNTMVTLW